MLATFKDAKKIFNEIGLDHKKARLGLVSNCYSRWRDSDELKRETEETFKKVT